MTMKNNEIKEFVNKCNRSYECAKCTVLKMEEDEVIEYKAEIKAKLISFERWSIFISFVALAIATVGILKDGAGFNVAYIFLTLAAIALVLYFVDRHIMARWIKALSYLEDYSQIKENQSN